MYVYLMYSLSAALEEGQGDVAKFTNKEGFAEKDWCKI